MSLLIGKSGEGAHRIEGGAERGGNHRICREQRIMRSIILYFERELRHFPESSMSRSLAAEGDGMKRKGFSDRTVSETIGKVEENPPSPNS